MTFVEVLLQPVFNILDFTIKIPIDFSNHYVQFKLYYIVILLFVVELLKVIWVAMMDNGSGLYIEDSTTYEQRTDMDTGEVHETRIKRHTERK